MKKIEAFEEALVRVPKALLYFREERL